MGGCSGPDTGGQFELVTSCELESFFSEHAKCRYLRMALTLDLYLDGSSDQELVDLYSTHAPGGSRDALTTNQIHHASRAAYALERRGYVERAGTWNHHTLPALRAQA